MTSESEFLDKEMLHLQNIDAGTRGAERVLSLMDPSDADSDPEVFEEMYERIFHCEVCTVREVLEVFWPPVQNYIDWLRSQIPGLPNESND